MILYMKCDDKLLDWSHRRRNRTYAAAANFLAILLGLIAALAITGLFPLISLLLFFALLVPFLLLVFYREQKLHDELLEAWWEAHLDGKLV